jgi:hypothetical protein
MVAMSGFGSGDVLCFTASCRVEPSLGISWFRGAVSQVDKGFLDSIFWGFAPLPGVENQGIAETGK